MPARPMLARRSAGVMVSISADMEGLGTCRKSRILAGLADPTKDQDGQQPQHQDTRRTHAQPEEHQPRSAPQSAGGHYRTIRLWQVLTRVRHAVRGGTTSLRRIVVGLCAPVPAVDGKT